MTVDVLGAKAYSIAADIARSEEARRYWEAREKMEQNERAQALFEELKLKTNARLALEQRYAAGHPQLRRAQQEEQSVRERLGEIPVALQYQEAKDELNELLQGVMQILLARLSEQVPVEPGPREGCGQGHGGAGCDCAK